MPLTSSMEDYLEAVLVLQQQKGYARCVDVAEFLNVKKPSVSRAVKELSKKKCLLKKDDGTLSLTEQGWQIAQQIYEKHQFFTRQLIEAGVPHDIAAQDACRLEHVIRSCLDKCPGGDTIGEIIIMKLNEDEKKIFEDFLSFLQLHPELKKWELTSEPVLSLSDLEIDPSQRLVRCNQKEVALTTKEYNLLCLLAVNNGRVLSYSQIYEKVWGEALTVNERGTVGYHVRNLRRKLYSADPHHPFIIESIREIGYRFQTTS